MSLTTTRDGGQARAWATAAARAQLRRTAAAAGVRRRFAPHQLRHAHAVDGARRRAADRHPTPAGPQQPRHHLRLPPGHRQRRDHRHRPRPTRTDDPRQRIASTLRTPASRAKEHFAADEPHCWCQAERALASGRCRNPSSAAITTTCARLCGCGAGRRPRVERAGAAVTSAKNRIKGRESLPDSKSTCPA